MRSMQKGSYTVEAAITIPILLMVFVMAMKVGILLYKESEEYEKEISLEKDWVVETFYRDNLAGGILGGEE